MSKRDKKKKWQLEKDKDYASVIASEILRLRTNSGCTEFECARTIKINPALIETYKKNFKFFRKICKKAKKNALNWWIAEYGRRALFKNLDAKAVENYLLMEFGYAIGQHDDDERFGFDITVRTKDDSET